MCETRAFPATRVAPDSIFDPHILQLAAGLRDLVLTGNGSSVHKSNKFAIFMVIKTCAAAAEKTCRCCTIVNI
jgi:hypothetical protein